MVDKTNYSRTRYYGLTRPVIKSLITQERAQKFDLLTHLIANLRRPLIVSGPEGIGKSTLLKILFEQRPVDGYYHYLAAESGLNFNTLQDRLQQFVRSESSYKGFSLDDALVLLAHKRLKLVLMIDNAGVLAPGVIEMMSAYATAHPVLRVIFALSQDDVAVKTLTDPSIDDCHFIELPSLSENQCREFLHNLSGNPDALVSFSAISDLMVEHLYQETKGVPGKIVDCLPHFSEIERVARRSAGISWGMVLLLVFAGLVYWGWSELFPTAGTRLERADIDWQKDDLQEQQTKVMPLPVQKTEGAGKTRQPFSDVELLRKVESVESEDNANTVDAETAKLPAVVKAAEVVPVRGEGMPEKTGIIADRSEDDRSWLFEQPSEAFTLQLMVLSSRQSILNVLRKYSALQSDLKYVETRGGGKAKFILLYGVFGSHAEAGRAARQLPGEFREAWVRRFAVLQSDINKAA